MAVVHTATAVLTLYGTVGVVHLKCEFVYGRGGRKYRYYKCACVLVCG